MHQRRRGPLVYHRGPQSRRLQVMATGLASYVASLAIGRAIVQMLAKSRGHLAPAAQARALFEHRGLKQILVGGSQSVRSRIFQLVEATVAVTSSGWMKSPPAVVPCSAVQQLGVVALMQAVAHQLAARATSATGATRLAIGPASAPT